MNKSSIHISQTLISTGFKYTYSTFAQLVLTLVLVVLLIKVGLQRKLVVGETANSTKGASGVRKAGFFLPFLKFLSSVS